MKRTKEFNDPTIATLDVSEVGPHAVMLFAELAMAVQHDNPDAQLVIDYRTLTLWRPKTDEEVAAMEESNAKTAEWIEQRKKDEAAKDAAVAEALGVTVEEYLSAVKSTNQR